MIYGPDEILLWPRDRYGRGWKRKKQGLLKLNRTGVKVLTDVNTVLLHRCFCSRFDFNSWVHASGWDIGGGAPATVQFNLGTATVSGLNYSTFFFVKRTPGSCLPLALSHSDYSQWTTPYVHLCKSGSIELSIMRFHLNLV